MLLAVGSDKGAPGATTLAAALARAWGGPRLLLELDPRGADLPLRLTRPEGSALLAAPSLVGLSLATRDPAAQSLERFAQPTTLGVPVIAGEMSVRAHARIAAQLPAVAKLARDWQGTVVADVGLLHPGNPALVAARAATCTLYAVRPTLEGFAHLRDNLPELAQAVADPRTASTPIAVVVIVASGEEKAALQQLRSLLEQLGFGHLPVVSLAWDPAGASLLWSQPTSKKFARSSLARSASSLAVTVAGLWPALTAQPPPVPAPSQVTLPDATGGPATGLPGVVSEVAQ